MIDQPTRARANYIIPSTLVAYSYFIIKARHTRGVHQPYQSVEISGPLSLPKTSLTVPEFIHLLFAGSKALANARHGKRHFIRGKVLELLQANEGYKVREIILTQLLCF
jgi:hypothetical protein